MTIQKYSAQEALNRILRLFGDGTLPSSDAPGTVPGYIYSEDESLSRLAELLWGSLDGVIAHLPVVIQGTNVVHVISENATLDATYSIIVATQPITITLPSAIDFVKSFSITNNSNGQVTVQCHGAETLGGENSWIIAKRYSTMTIYSDGTGWQFK